MKRWLSIFVAMIILCMPLNCLAAGDVYEDTLAETFTHEDTVLPYRLMLPENYNQEESYPLILFLHGAGERGTDNLTQMKNVFQKIANRNKDAILLAPQCDPDNQWVDTPWAQGPYSVDDVPESNELQAVMALIKNVQENYSVDADRIYATGLSMGAFGVWDLMVRHNDVFAAGIACCGGGDPSKGMVLKDTPMYVFHGDADPTVPVTGSREVVSAIMEAGGEVIEYIEYPGFQHGIWDIAFEEVGLFDVLKEHRLSDRTGVFPDGTKVPEEVGQFVDDTTTTGAKDNQGQNKSFNPIWLFVGCGIAVVVVVVVILVLKNRKKSEK